MWCGLMWSVRQCCKKCHIYKKDYFLHLFGEEFLDALIAETNLLEGKTLSKGHLAWKLLSNGKLSVIRKF